MREKEVLLLEQKEELQQREEDLNRKMEELLKGDQQKDDVVQRQNLKLNQKDEEIQRRGVRIIVKKAELNLKQDELRHLETCQQENISKLEQKDTHIVSLEGQLQELQVELCVSLNMN